jgi:outer membrane protein assembly factor BamB
VLALTGDGKLHSLWVSNGHEPSPPLPFLPPNANASGLIAYGNTAYVATSDNCGGVDNGVWALDLHTKEVTHWKTAAIAGTAGPAVGPDGSLFVTGGRELTSLAPRDLKPIAKYTTDGAGFTSSPILFDYKGKDLVAAATDDGRLHLLSAGLQGGPLDRTASFSARDYATGALTTWQDAANTRWILAPAGGAQAAQAGFKASNGEVKNGAIVAWRIAEKDGGSLKLEPGWMSRDMLSPLPPIVVNGVIFALASGEYRSNDPQLPVFDRPLKSKAAVLYALDPFTGKELWSSGRTISNFTHNGGLAAGGGRVYVSTYDSTQYAFGIPMEH